MNPLPAKDSLAVNSEEILLQLTLCLVRCLLRGLRRK